MTIHKNVLKESHSSLCVLLFPLKKNERGRLPKSKLEKEVELETDILNMSISSKYIIIKE